MKQIDEFFEQNIPKTLYHYTGIGALLGISESRKIWASHAYYLNDAKEILYARDVLCELLAKIAAENNRGKDEEYFLSEFKKWLVSFGGARHIFIFSLSEEPSLLSQWRSYTPHGKGVSLGFSPSVLERVLQSTELRIAKCLYDSVEHEELMRALVEKLLISFGKERAQIEVRNKPEGQKYYEYFEKFRGDILQVFAVVKHPAFKEECEWRIISKYYPKYTVPEIKFREGASMLMPYCEIKLPEDGFLFERVILGPSEHEGLSMEALSSFLSNKKVCNETVNARIPYRKW